MQRLQARVPDFDLDGVPDGGWGWGIQVGAFALVTGVFAIVMWRLRKRGGDVTEPAPAEETIDELEASEYADALDDELAKLD